MANQREPDAARLRALLAEDLEDTDDVEELLVTLRRLPGWTVPEPGKDFAVNLDARLDDVFPQAGERTRAKAWASWWPLLVLRSQVRVVHSEIWLASLLLIALGTLVTLATNQMVSGQMLPLVVLAPLVSVLGVAMLYDNLTIQMLELEATTAVSGRVLLLARLTLVFGFNLSLLFGGSLVLSLLHDDLSLWPLVMSWFAPMTFLSALAFLLSVLLMDALAGGFIGMSLWIGHVILRSSSWDHIIIDILRVPGLGIDANRPLLLLAAVLLTAVALWLAGLNDRYARGAA